MTGEFLSPSNPAHSPPYSGERVGVRGGFDYGWNVESCRERPSAPLRVAANRGQRWLAATQSGALSVRPCGAAFFALLLFVSALITRANPPADGVYQDKKHGVTLHYPGSWTTKTDADYDLHLTPAAGSATRTVTFDAPDVPAIPLFGIPMGLVESHFIDDLKSRHPGCKVVGATDFSLSGANKARLVLLSWKREGMPHQCASLLIVHGNDVFILSADADDADWAATRADFDKIAASIKWSA